ncbi:MAG: hypothetical protein JXD19_12270, partial [Deltaproteobacteria bacterium]|nr:hypothetical protein [Deltaproteobacteria bacterium]
NPLCGLPQPIQFWQSSKDFVKVLLGQNTSPKRHFVGTGITCVVIVVEFHLLLRIDRVNH